MGEGRQQKYRAIVIDDMDYCRDLLTDFLHERGYQVVTLPDVTSCPLFAAQNTKCTQGFACADFLLTDNRMPHMEGIDFLELQAQGKCHIPTFGKAIFSAFWTEEAVNRAEQLGCKSFSKPYDFLLLGRWLDEQEQSIPPNRILEDLGNINCASKKNCTSQRI